MKEYILKVQMLGKFSITLGDIRLDDSANRSLKVWQLLAYLIYHRNRVVSQEELIRVLWGNEKNDNPAGALKTTLWRARSLLEPLGASAGHELVLRKNNGYQWNPEAWTELDVEEFEFFCKLGAERAEGVRLNYYRKALSLYQSDFLSRFSSEAWVEPLAAYYHNLYIDVVMETLLLLGSRAYYHEAESLSRAALRVSPYHEPLYQHLMISLLEMGEDKKAATVYEEMRELLLSNLGVMPSEESQAIYEKIFRNVSGQALSPDMIRMQLREQDPPAGPLVCDYAFFKLFYQAEARSAARRGDAVHIGILSVTGKGGKDVSQRSIERAMESLRVQLQESLRRGDVAARCSSTQYLVMLLQANYENSRMVCERIAQAFARAYPRFPVRVQCAILPLEPLPEPSPRQPRLSPQREFRN